MNKLVIKRCFNYRPIPLLCLVAVISVLLLCLGIIYAIIFGFVLLSLITYLFVKKKVPIFVLVLIIIYIVLSISTFFAIKSYENAIIEETEYFITARVSANSTYNQNGEVVGKIVLDEILIENVKLGKKQNLKFDAELIRSGKVLHIGEYLIFKGDIINIQSKNDYKGLSKRSNVVYKINTSSNIKIIESKLKTNEKLKLAIYQNMFKYMKKDTAGFCFGMLFGDKSKIDNEIKSDFSNTGLAHIFAVSGLHIGLVASAIIAILKKLRMKNFLVLPIVSAFLLFYSWLCGFPPSTVRASIMIVSFLLASMIGLKNDMLSSLCLSALLLLLFKPLILFKLSFLMSYIAVFSLIGLTNSFKVINKFFGKKVGGLITASVCVNIGLLPLILNSFNSVNLIFLVANLITLPIIGVVFPLLMALSFLSLLPFLGIALKAISYIFDFLLLIVNKLNDISFFSISFTVTPIMVFFAFILLVVLSKFTMIKKQFKTLISIMLVILIVVMSSITMYNDLTKYPSINTLNANLEKSIHILQYERKYFLVISGAISASDIKIISMYCFRENISKIDYLVKYNLEIEEAMLLANSNVKYGSLITQNENSYIGFFQEIEYFYLNNELGIILLSDKEIAITVSDIKLGILKKDTENSYDLIFTETKINVENEIQIVTENILFESYNNIIKTSFTIYIKNGKIKCKEIL